MTEILAVLSDVKTAFTCTPALNVINVRNSPQCFHVSTMQRATLYAAAAPAVRTAVKPKRHDNVIFCPANTNKDNANTALGSCNS